MNSAAKELIQYLRTHEGITSMEAFRLFSVTRLSGMIYSLKKQGYIFRTITHTTTTQYGRRVKYAEYQLIGEGDSNEDNSR